MDQEMYDAMQAANAANYDYSYQAPNPLGSVFWLVFWVVLMIAYWKVFVKAGEKGWKSLIPIYNIYILLKIVGKPGWWLLLFLIPFVNIAMWLILSINVGKVFGKSSLWSVLLLFFFSVIGALMLGFGSAKYHKPGAGSEKTIT